MKKTEKEKFERFCSSCGSVNLKTAVTPWKAASVGSPNEAKCLDCGFEGIVLEGKKGFLKKFRKKLVSKNE